MRTQRVHIVSCGPRTGSTLLAEAMRACFDVDAWEDHEAGMYAEAPPGARVYLTKSPGDLLRVGPRLRVDRDFHVVYLVRDPRDTITSRHGSAPDSYWASLRYWKLFEPEGERLRERRRFTAVRYEDFVSDPDATQRRLAEAMPFLHPTAPFSRYHEVAEPSSKSLLALKGVRPIGSDRVGGWTAHLPRVKGQILIHGPISQDLIRHGYESDRSWEGLLDGVDPDLSAGHLSEHFSPRAIARRRAGRYRQAAKAVLRQTGLTRYRP